MPNPTKSGKLRFLFIPPFLLLTLALAAVACGGGEQDSVESPDSGPVTFDISLSDEPGEQAIVSLFEPNEVTVAAGQEVTFNLTNDGTAPHNLRIVGPDGEFNTTDDVVVDPEVMKPGDSAVLVWTAPSKAGTIIFRCDFHLNTGTITIKSS
jgi:plastocyanin